MQLGGGCHWKNPCRSWLLFIQRMGLSVCFGLIVFGFYGCDASGIIWNLWRIIFRWVNSFGDRF